MTAPAHIPGAVSECEPTYRLDSFIAEAREEMGEERWQKLEREWSAPVTTPIEEG